MARGGERPAGRPPATGAYGRRRMRGPRRLGPIPDALAGRAGKGKQPERRRRRGPRLGLLRSPRRRQSSPRQLSPAAPISGPSSAPAGLGRRLRSPPRTCSGLRPPEEGRARASRKVWPHKSWSTHHMFIKLSQVPFVV